MPIQKKPNLDKVQELKKAYQEKVMYIANNYAEVLNPKQMWAPPPQILPPPAPPVGNEEWFVKVNAEEPPNEAEDGGEAGGVAGDHLDPLQEGMLQPAPLDLGPDEIQADPQAQIFFSPSKLKGGIRSCETCGGGYEEAKFVQTADGHWLCARCYRLYGQCVYCGWRPTLDKLTLTNGLVHTYCVDCAPARKTKLYVKQKLQFNPSRDLIGTRREKVWQKTSR